jgi:hypothetical protein
LVFNSRLDSRHNTVRFEWFWLLFTVKPDLTLIPEILFLSCLRIQAWPSPSLFYLFSLANLELLVGLNLWTNPWVLSYDQILSIGTPNGSIEPYHMDLLLWWDCWSHTPGSYRGSSHSEHWLFHAELDLPMLFSISCILVQLSKSWQHCITTSPCTIPCALWLHHIISINTQVHLSLEPECRYPIPPWVYPW